MQYFLKHLHKHWILSAIMISFTVTGCGSNTGGSSASSDDQNLYAYYGDTKQQRVISIDVAGMRLEHEVNTIGKTPYTVGRAGEMDKLYAITRDSHSIDVLDLFTLKKQKVIPLTHSPRSCAFNEYLGLQLVSGKDKPLSSLINVDSDKVIATVGRDMLVKPSDFGGSNATGHPMWLDATHFVLLDREVRAVQLYEVIKTNGILVVTYKDTLYTPTSAHHFLGKGIDGMDGSIRKTDKITDTFYLLTEGSPKDSIAPKLLKVLLKNERLIIEASADLGGKQTAIKDMGAHHGTFHPTQNKIYVGSTEGHMYIIDMQTMKVVKTIETGKGSGHTTFIPKRNLAIVTNHHDTFITIIDAKTNKKIKDLTVSGTSINDTILQSHTSFTDKNQDFFYAFATDNGIFYEVNLENLEISRTLYTGGTPKQGCSIRL
jgi:DNA-binding beta-propeller fold protein YncE